MDPITTVILAVRPALCVVELLRITVRVLVGGWEGVPARATAPSDEGRPRQHAPDKCGIAPAARDPPSRDQLSAIRGHRTYVSLSE